MERGNSMEIVLYKDGYVGPSKYITNKLRGICTELEPCSGNSCEFCFDRDNKQVLSFVKQAILPFPQPKEQD